MSPLSASQVLHFPLVEIWNRPIKFWSKIVPRVCLTNQTIMHASISGFLVGTVQDFLDSCALCRLRDSQTGSMHQILCQPDLARKKTQIIFSTKWLQGAVMQGDALLPLPFGFLFTAWFGFLFTGWFGFLLLPHLDFSSQRPPSLISKHHTMTSLRGII